MSGSPCLVYLILGSGGPITSWMVTSIKDFSDTYEAAVGWQVSLSLYLAFQRPYTLAITQVKPHFFLSTNWLV